ncbi:MAG TPA: D-alanyl-D-alanine carboxypeptidase family protein [Ktedonobacteraceae bacterium]|nr:D-alanyl-D-alanine carboxypeptidase family protein [Ktedonobacteraceae bacterium]
MKRVNLVTVLLVLCIEAVILVPSLLFTPTGAKVLTDLHPAPTPTPDPVLTVQGTPPPIQSAAAYLLDADTNHVLVNINGQKRLPMASTTKIMTALLAIQKGNLDQIVTIQQDAIDESQKNNGSSAQLVVGDQIRLGDLLYGLMLPSGDDAAIAIADTISGSPANFVRLMNNYAHQLHLTHTHYSNPDGLTYKLPDGQVDPNHYTTAADLAQLTHVALQNHIFAQIVELQRYVLPPTSAHHGYTWETTDNLLSYYAGATGVKTGYTLEAGYCLVFSAINAGHHLIGVVLHDSDDDTNQRFIDAQTLLDWGFHLPLRPPR